MTDVSVSSHTLTVHQPVNHFTIGSETH